MPAPTWISHRGYCREATENTAEAFRAAIDLGFNHLETDLRCSADGHIVLAHDPSLARLCDNDLSPEQTSRQTMEQLRLRGGEQLVFLDNILKEFTNQHWIFDIKPESAIRTINSLLNWWRQPQYADFFRSQVRFLFWHQAHQDYLLQHRPEAVCMARLAQCRRVGFACLLGLPALSGLESGVSYALPPRLKGLPLMRPSILARYRARGGKVLAYLPETESDARDAVNAGVDEILTNGQPIP